MSAQKLSVNLLPPSEFEQSFWGRFLKWAVTAGRYIIILTELVVILAFLSRFKLDEDLRNVNERIETQINFLESEQPRLDEFLIVQKRIGLVETALKKRVMMTETMKYMDNKKPPEIITTQMSISKEEVTLSAITLSETALGDMMVSMSRDGIWKSLDLTQIISDTDNGIKFTLTARK